MATTTLRLEIALNVSIGSKVFPILGGDIASLELDLRTYGFSGECSFWVFGDLAKDELFTPFLSGDRTDLKFTVAGVHFDVEEPPESLTLNALATEKWTLERVYVAEDGEPVSARLYRMRFEDPMAVLWRQHHPLVLKSGAKLDEMIEAAAFEGIKLSVNVADAGTTRGLVFLPLDASRRTSFYDFVLWYLDGRGAHLHYDYAKNEYSLDDQRKTTSKTVSVRKPEVVLPVPSFFMETSRHSSRVLNASTLAKAETDVASDVAVSGIRRDFMIRSSLTSDTDTRVDLETDRVRWRSEGLTVDFAKYPSVVCFPGQKIKLDNEPFGAQLAAVNKTWRVRRWKLEASSDPETTMIDRGNEVRDYETTIHTVWESAAETCSDAPEFEWPHYPVLVEGKIISPGNELGDRWHAVHQDDETSEWYYNVLVPLWNQEIRVPFEPGHFPGQTYFPTYKDARVLLRMHFDRAELAKMLDWGNDVQLAQETQGNRLMLGKNATTQTAMTHAYENDLPTLKLDRVSTGDFQRLHMLEGTMELEVWEDDSLTEAMPTYDLTPEVAAASTDLESAASGATGEIESSFTSATGNLKGQLEGSKSEVEGAVDAFQGELSAEIQKAKAVLDGAVNAVGESVGQLTGAASDAVSALRNIAVL